MNLTKDLKCKEVKCPHCKHIFVCDGSNKFSDVMVHMSQKHPDIFLKAYSKPVNS